METISSNKEHDQIIAKIHALDLAPIKFKLMDSEEGYGWSREYADHIEIEYKRFLTLLVKYPEASIAPSKEVDKFWHGHILDTLKYAEDCHKVFGYFLHHFPYFGMRGSEDAANLAAAANTMNRLYREEFGDAGPAQASGYCGAAGAVSYCGAATSKDAPLAGEQPSYCGATARAASYCGAAGAVSYCGAATSKDAPLAAEQPSYCGATAKAASYCGAAGAVSYCGATAGKDGQVAAKQSSYCGATGAASYCGAANIGDAYKGMARESVLNTALRPTLPPSAAN